MVFHWSLSNCKSPQVLRTFLCILTGLNNTVVWMVLIYLPIFISSSSFFKPLGTIRSVLVTIGVTITLTFHSFLSSLAKSKYFCLSFHFLWFSFCGLPRKLSFFSWLSLGLVVWSRLGDLFVSWNLREFSDLILLDGFLFVDIPFGGMVNFQFLTEFPVDYLSLLDISTLIRLYYYYYFYYYSLFEFFTPVFAGDLSQESERQQVLLGLQDYSQYSARS